MFPGKWTPSRIIVTWDYRTSCTVLTMVVALVITGVFFLKTWLQFALDRNIFGIFCTMTLCVHYGTGLLAQLWAEEIWVQEQQKANLMELGIIYPWMGTKDTYFSSKGWRAVWMHFESTKLALGRRITQLTAIVFMWQASFFGSCS